LISAKLPADNSDATAMAVSVARIQGRLKVLRSAVVADGINVFPV
jgi:hypothetical protein